MCIRDRYYIDGSIRMHSNRRIEAAPDAVIRLMTGVKLLMLRNEHTMDGTHEPIPEEGADENISIDGGRWEEMHEKRAGYGKSGMYDSERSLYGVSTCLLFNHIRHLTLTNMVFAHTAGFSVQIGNARSVLFEQIAFDHCYADGLHINGNCEDVWVNGAAGEVGDDLVALNMYDWLNSSVTFGPARYVICENIDSAPSSRYKSMRIEPGVYTYADGTAVDCALRDAIIRGVRGIRTFKLYYQTPRYTIGTEPEKGRVGSAGPVYFEDIEIDLDRPIDAFPAYLEGDPVRGAFGAFELGANIDCISLENIRLKRYPDRFPRSFLVCVGPKSIRRGDQEIFDPYISNHVERMIFSRVTINGEPLRDAREAVHITRFDDVNQDGHSTAAGSVGKMIVTD